MARKLDFSAIVAALGKLGASDSAQLLDQCDDALWKGGTESFKLGVITLPGIARHILYLAQSIGDKARDGMGTGSAPQWEKMVPRYGTMRSSGGLASLLPIVVKDDLRNFCWLRHLRQGPRKERFAAAMALFVLHEASTDSLKHPYFLQLLPMSERELPQRLAEFFAQLLNDAAIGRGKKPPFPDAAGLARPRAYPEVTMAFAVSPEEEGKLARFHARFESRDDRHAHLLLYRPRRKEPSELIRSFVAISAAKPSRAAPSSNYHNVTYVYRAPSPVGHDERQGQGWALPLSRGLYLVNGQRSSLSPPVRLGEKVERPPREPFMSLDVLFFAWSALDSSLMRGLMMTWNNDTTPLITRVCAIPTLVSQSADAQLGAITLEKLPDRLQSDWDIEKGLADGLDDAPSLRLFNQFGSMSDLATRIGELCNNRPGEWEVAPGFTDVDGHALTPAEISRRLELALGVGREAQYNSDTGPFRFWEHLRFAPLSTPL